MALSLTQPFPTSSHGQPGPSLQKNCQSCGFQNLQVDLRCQKCGRRLRPLEPAASAPENVPASPAQPAPAPVLAAPAPARPAMPDHVRSEIHSRVERFKARRRAQTLPLPFEEPVLAEAGNVVAFPTLDEPAARPSQSKAAREAASAATATIIMATSPEVSEAAEATEPAALVAEPQVESPALQPPVVAAPATPVAATIATPQNLPAAPPVEAQTTPVAAPVQAAPPQFPLFVPPTEQPETEWQNFQIASLGKRLAGIGHDMGNILGGIALFAAPFYWIAGKPHFNLHLLAAFVAGALMICLLYGALFMAVIGSTPGMDAAGLRVVSFSGYPASRQQRLLRVAGALISAGSFLFGYLWAYVDEEKLYWHDHISKTVLTDSSD